MNKEDEQAKRLAKLQSTLASVQMPQADQNLVGYHRERRPLAEEELGRASPSGLIAAANESSTENDRLVLRKEVPSQLVKESEEVGGQPELRGDRDEGSFF